MIARRILHQLQKHPTLLLEFADRNRFSAKSSLYIHEKVPEFGYHMDEPVSRRLRRYEGALSAFPIEKLAHGGDSLPDHESVVLLSLYFDLVRSIISEIDLSTIASKLVFSSSERGLITFLQAGRRDFQEQLSTEEEKSRRTLWAAVDSDPRLDYIRTYFDYLSRHCRRPSRR